MTRRHVQLRRCSLAYADGMAVQTATSGSVQKLDELRLIVTEGGAIAALGATRLNIAYLTGLDPETLCRQCGTVFDQIDWRLPWPELTARLPPNLVAPVRMLFQMAAADGAARQAEVPLAVWLGGTATAAVPTNQTLFLSDDATLLARAEAYMRRGFTELKLRCGAGPVQDDLAHLRLLRNRFGAALHLSADVNGCWTETDLAAAMPALAALDLSYLEQPLPAAEWDAVARLSRSAPFPVMLDESLADPASIERLASTAAAPLAHLKLAKLGGLDQLMQAGRRLQEAGIGVMVGQMNEGTVSTLAAAHAAAALRPRFHELYGADGIGNDPASPLHYEAGQLHLPPGPGLGLTRHELIGTLLREHTS